MSELSTEPVRGDDIDITHKIYSGKNQPRNIIVKFISHKKTTAILKKRTTLKKVKISQLFPHCPAVTALASKWLCINENLTPLRRYLMKEANQMRKDGTCSVCGLWTVKFMLRLRLVVRHRESIPRKTSTTYDSKLARLHFSASLSLTA